MIIEFIFNIIKPQLSSNKVLVHFTQDRSTAMDILTEGFYYSEYCENSSTEISPDVIDLRYKYNLYKPYGDFLIIMCIPLSLFDNYHHKDSCSRHDVLYNMGLCEYLPENDLEYRLKNTYVYGFIDIKKMKFISNEFFGK